MNTFFADKIFFYVDRDFNVWLMYVGVCVCVCVFMYVYLVTYIRKFKNLPFFRQGIHVV